VEPSVSYGGVGSPSRHDSSPGFFSTGSLIVRRARTVEPSVSYGAVGSPSQHDSSPGFFSTGSLNKNHKLLIVFCS
jgi:hypothetical protein